MVSVHVGKIRPLGPARVPSAFVKPRVFEAVRIDQLGVEGDEQADRTVHGGIEKAVYGYSHDHYADWRREYPQHAATLIPGAFGENLCIEGVRESDLCVGDVHQVGSSTLQVCQPRQPCYKLALHFADKMMPKAMVRTGRAGWYYRVLSTGQVVAGDTVQLTRRPNPDFSFTRLVELISHGRPTRSELEQLQVMPELAEQWREHAGVLLQRMKLEAQTN